MNRTARAALLAAVCILATACAVRLGGARVVEYDVAALHIASTETPAAAANRIASAGAEVVLLSAARDSAWFAAVAEAAGLDLSGPGTTGARGLAFLADIELLGDTSLVLEVPGGGSIHMHDALYKIDDNRNIDLMMVSLDAADVRAAVSRLLLYIATDVGSTAALVLAIEAARPQQADSAATLVRATLASEADCWDDAAPAGSAVRLVFGPSARLQCESARRIDSGVAARLQVQR